MFMDAGSKGSANRGSTKRQSLEEWHREMERIQRVVAHDPVLKRYGERRTARGTIDYSHVAFAINKMLNGKCKVVNTCCEQDIREAGMELIKQWEKGLDSRESDPVSATASTPVVAPQHTPSTAGASTNSTISTAPPFELEAAVFPPNSLLADYFTCARERLESADSYIIGSILPVVAGCLARRVYFKWGEEKIYPNIFALLAGRPGERKSSAVNLAERIAKSVLLPRSFLPPACSSESMLDEYDVNTDGLLDKVLLLDDANALLSFWKGSGYGGRVCQQFLGLYDCKGFSETFQKNKKEGNVSGHRSVSETSTSVLLGATFDICRLQGRGISSGLQRRFLFYAAEKHGSFIPCPPVPNPAELDRLTGRFHKLCEMEMECRFSKRAMTVWEGYQRRNRELLEQAGTDAISSRLNGAPRAVQKIAMLFEVSCWANAENRWDGTIRSTTLELAIQHVDHCLRTASRLDALAGREATAVLAESLLARIRRDFGSQQEGGFIVLTKTELTAKYAPHAGRAHAWKPADLYDRFIPYLIAKGLARLGGKDGKKVWYEFDVDDL